MYLFKHVSAVGGPKGTYTFGFSSGLPVITGQQVKDRRHLTKTASSSDTATAPLANERATRGHRTKSDLTNINGVGKRNQQLLEAAGISNLHSLLCKYALELNKDADRAQEYLRESVKIRNKAHCSSIIAYLEHHIQTHGLPSNTCNLRLAVEGNIGAGKSTFLQYITQESPTIQQRLHLVPEPVNDWQRVRPPGAPLEAPSFNILQKFYEEPSKYAYLFQNYVFLSRMMQERNSRDCGKDHRLLERSVFSDRMVFVRAVVDAQWMSPMELAIYDSWFKPLVEQLGCLVPDGFIYLRADPDKCMQRLRKRNRSEETGVSYDYLEGLHSKHEDWLNTNTGAGSLQRPQGLILPYDSVEKADQQYAFPAPLAPYPQPGVTSLMPAVPEEIRGELHLIQPPESVAMAKGFLQGTPALVLDCNQDFDVENDKDAKMYMSRKVEAYLQYLETRDMVRRQQEGALRKPRGAFSTVGDSFSSSLLLEVAREMGHTTAEMGQALQLTNKFLGMTLSAQGLAAQGLAGAR